jgi:hypothetical protein
MTMSVTQYVAALVPASLGYEGFGVGLPICLVWSYVFEHSCGWGFKHEMSVAKGGGRLEYQQDR